MAGRARLIAPLATHTWAPAKPVIPENRQPFHFGVSFVFAPVPDLGAATRLRFQSELAAPPHFVEFDSAFAQGEKRILQRASPPLGVTLGPVAPQVAQLIITAPRPTQSLDEFIADAKAVCDVYRTVWPGTLQIVSRDCTIRHLCPVQDGHSFKYLWERRLRQDEDDLGILGRPVLGGGLRLVMPARPDVPDDPIVELKIESLFEDTSQLFIDVAFVWRQPQSDSAFDPAALLHSVDQFLQDEVTRFITYSE